MSIATTAVMPIADAERITEKIRVNAINARDALEKLQTLLTEARDGQAHIALGYASWTAYLADVMGEQPLRLPRDQRQQIVGYLAGEGMSNRGIAAITGTSHMQASRDRAAAGVTNVPPAPSVDAETGEISDDYVTDQADLDNLTDATTGEEMTTPDEAPRHANDSEGEPSPGSSAPTTAPPVTGLDGKTYQRRDPKKPRRSPLPDDARRAGWELDKTIRRLKRIGDDDRFAANTKQMAPHLRSHLSNAIDVCQDLLDRINNQEESTK